VISKQTITYKYNKKKVKKGGKPANEKTNKQIKMGKGEGFKLQASSCCDVVV
jgi:hypothetical protein